MGDRDAPARHRLSDVVAAFLAGTYFAFVLLGYVFVLEVYVSSTVGSFLVVACSWLVGLLVGLHLKSTPRQFSLLLAVGALAYFAAGVIAGQFPHDPWLLAPLAICVTASGAAAGNFFPYAQAAFPRIKYLLVHENNGFILGFALSLFAPFFKRAWLLDVAPATLLGLLAVTLLYARRARSEAPARSVEVVTGPLFVASDHMFPLFVSGLHFGILSVCLFLTIQVFVSASFTAAALVVIAWILGTILNMNLAVPRSLSASMGVSIVCYYALLMLTSVFTPYEFLLPLIALLVFVAALPSGRFFREFASRFSSRSVFLHQNNGFVLGYVVSLFGFAAWGVNFLYWAPLLSYATAFLGQSRRSLPAFTCMLIVTFLSIEMDSPETFWTLLVAVAVGAASFFWRHGTSLSLSHSKGEGATAETPPASGAGQLPAWAGRAVVFLAGFSVVQLHHFVSRDFSSVLGFSEVSVLIVTAAYLTGLSVGYGASRILPLALVKSLAPIVLLTHLFLAVFTRVIAATLISRGFGVELLYGLTFVAAFCTSSFFALLLPKLIDHMESGSLTAAYTWTLVGAACGVASQFVLLQRLPEMLWPSYFVALLALVVLLLWRTGWWMPSLIAGAFCVGLFVHYQGPLMAYAAEDEYARRDYAYPRVVFRGRSFHHSVEVIETFSDPERTQPRATISFIDGRESLRHGVDRDENRWRVPDPAALPYFLAELPAKYLYGKKGEKLSVLILGGGPSDAAFRARTFASRTTVVEPDRLLAKSAGEPGSGVYRRDEIDQLEIAIDDARHFLKTSPEAYDLIINHGGALDRLETVLLHGREFYQLVKSRLAPGGIFVESARERPFPENHEGRASRILRSVADTFSGYRLVETTADLTGSESAAIYASDTFEFSTDELTRILEADGLRDGTRVHAPGCEHFRLHRIAPLSLSNLDTLLVDSSWLRDRLSPSGFDTAASPPGVRPEDTPRPGELFSSLAEDSRLLAAILDRVKDRSFAMLLGGVVLAAALAKLVTWWPARGRSGSVVVVKDRPRPRRRRRKGALAGRTKVDRV